MSNNPLRSGQSSDAPRITPPKDPEERVRFWIERGNASLAAEGKGHLQWSHSNGNYYIEPRREAERRRLLGSE